MTRTIFPLCMCVVLVCAAQFGVPARAAGARPQRGIEGAIGKTVKKFRFNGTFGQCLTDLGKLAKVPIVGDWKMLKMVGVTKDKRISLRVDGARLSQLLDVAMAKATPKGMHLGWYIDDRVGAILVTTQHAALNSHRRTALTARRSVPVSGQTVTFNDTPLDAVIQYFRERTKLNFHVNWRALAAINVDQDTEVTLTVSGLPISRVLDLVTDQLSDNLDKFQRVYWLVDQGVIRISTGTALNTRLRTQIFDVGELLMPAVSVKMPRRIGLSGMTGSNTGGGRGRGGRRGGGGPRVGVVGAGVGLMIGAPDDSGQTDERAKAEQLREGVIGIIRDSIGQDMWEPSGRGSVKIIGNRLVISQTLLGYKLLDQSLRTRRRR